MIRLIFLWTIIIGACFGIQNDLVALVDINESEIINIENNPPGNECEIITNKNKRIKYRKNDYNTTIPGLKIKKNCDVSLIVDRLTNGTWTFKNEKIRDQTYLIIVVKTKEEIHLSDLEDIPENYIVHQTLPYQEKNITGCYLLKDQDLPTINLFETNKEFELVGQCGVRFKSIPSNEGTWTILAVFGTDYGMEGTFDLSVTPLEQKAKKLYANVPRGSNEYKLIGIREEVYYCIITDPHNNIVKIVENSGISFCEYEIPVVTSYHAGTWKFSHYFNKNDQVPIDYEINLNIVDDTKTTKVAIAYLKNKIHATCNTTGQHVIRTCKFINPADEIINVFLGMSTEKYEYYGESYGEKYDKQECGIIIHNPTELDYGKWKCVMTTTKSKTVQALVFLESSSYLSQPTEISKEFPNKVFVKTDNSFKVQCGTNRRLSYCWLRSPNGTMYNIISNYATSGNDLINTLIYAGLELDMGECGAQFSNASKLFDHGDWSCHMGMEYGPEIKTIVSVTVTGSHVADSDIFPVERRIKVLPNDETIKLSSMTIPGTKFDNGYCYWISPNGSRIVEKFDHRYIISRNDHSCSLTIKAVDVNEETGQWTCVIRSEEREYRTVIEVYIASTSFMWVIVSSVLLALTTLAAMVIFVYRRNNSLHDNDKKQLIKDAESIVSKTSYISRPQA